MIQIGIRWENDMPIFFQELTPSLANQALGPGLAAGARVVRRAARVRGFVFKDGVGVRPADRRRNLTESVRLRKTIRVRPITGIYGGRKYKRGAAAVYAGGPGARHAWLVHQGHGGPIKARPYPYLSLALSNNVGEVQRQFVGKIRERIARVVERAAARARGRGTVRSYGALATRARRVALRGRRR